MKHILAFFSLAALVLFIPACSSVDRGKNGGIDPAGPDATSKDVERDNGTPNWDEKPERTKARPGTSTKFAYPRPGEEKSPVAPQPETPQCEKKTSGMETSWEDLRRFAPKISPGKTVEPLQRGEESLVGAKPGASIKETQPEIFLAESPLAPVRESKEETGYPEKLKNQKTNPEPPTARKLSTEELFTELIRRQRRVVRENPSDMNVKLLMAEYLRLAGKYVEAEQMLLDVKAGKNLAVSMEKARIALELGRYKPICEELKNVLQEAVPLAPLMIPVSEFASEIHEYARYTPIASPGLAPGAYFQVYLELDNFVCEKRDNSHMTSMEIGYEIRDCADRVVFEKMHFDSWEYKTRSKLKYLFIRLSDYLPQNLLSGKYNLRVYIVDRLKPMSGKAEANIPFNVTGNQKSGYCGR
ncbi:MAG: tetratricopeptide repeat protein [Planctomycetota bacterium]|jgi:hypothetical protein